MFFLPRTFPLLPSVKEESEMGEFFRGPKRPHYQLHLVLPGHTIILFLPINKIKIRRAKKSRIARPHGITAEKEQKAEKK